MWNLHAFLIMGNGTLGNGTFQNVSGETGHFYHLGNGTFYSLGEGTLYSLGNGTLYPLGTILSSGNRETCPLGIGPLILWEWGHIYYTIHGTKSLLNRKTMWHKKLKEYSDKKLYLYK